MAITNFLKKAREIEAEHGKRRKEPGMHAEKHLAAHDESNWLVSYADMMTLLCGFFIMLFSMAKLDDAKYEKVKEAVSKDFHGQYVEPPSKGLGKEISRIVDDLGLKDASVVRSDPTGVTVTFESTLFFDTLSSELSPKAKKIMDQLAQAVATAEAKDSKKYQIVVEGHTDSRPIVSGLFPSNWELSTARASRVVRFFMEKGFEPNTLAAVGYGDTRPLEPSRKPSGEWDEAALAKNRRVVLRVLEPSTESVPLESAPETVGSAQPYGPMPQTALPAASGPLPNPQVNGGRGDPVTSAH